MPTHAPRLWTTLIVLVLSGGCVAPPAEGPSKDALHPPLAWPGPPAAARIRYVRSVDGPRSWGVAKGFWGGFVGALTGEADNPLVRPTGVAERAGVLFVADPGAQALFIFDAARQRSLTVKRLGEETLVSPVAVALGPENTVFLVDSWLKKIFVVDAEGKLQRVVADPGFARPAAAAYDAARGRLYVADSMAHRISVYAPEGTLLKTFGANGGQDGQFNAPTHLALALDGRLLVTDALNFRVQIFDPEGNFLQAMGTPGDGAGNFAAPKGLAADRLGRIYVVDALLNALQIFDRGGALLLGVGEFGTRVGQFSLPGGLFIDPGDKIYVADAFNQRIQVFEHVPGAEKEEGP